MLSIFFLYSINCEFYFVCACVSVSQMWFSGYCMPPDGYVFFCIIFSLFFAGVVVGAGADAATALHNYRVIFRYFSTKYPLFTTECIHICMWMWIWMYAG